MADLAAEQEARFSAASKFFTASERLIPVPRNASPQERRTYYIAGLGMPVGLLTHFLLMLLFWYWDIPALALFNVLSVIAWSVSILLMRRKRTAAAFIIFSIEIFVHTSLTVYFVGWDMGIQYFLVLLMSVLVLSMWSLGVKVVASASCIALYTLLYTYALRNPPQVLVDPAQLYLVNVFNMWVAFLSMAGTALYGVGTADRLEAELETEHEKSEALLNNILPASVSVRLKSSEGTIADHCDGASILFADVVNFTPMSATMTPTELVELLNEVFSDFDDLTQKYGLEKIKTIGDCYMAASGVPQPRVNHAQILTEMALEMQALVSGKTYHGQPLAFRIGINSGPVVAGVIGRKKFAYDLWGDAVNTASRMESHGSGGRVQITRSTYELIKNEFDCEPQGTIQVKGKGPVDVWYVTGRKNGPVT